MSREEPLAERFTDDEQHVLLQFFTNVDRPVFALINLPEVVKGALFARYSRSSKSLRRLFLDEFLDVRLSAKPGPAVGTERAEKLYRRVLDAFGDDSIAQLGGAHLACEGISNIVTKVIEWGRLMAYLEQSTRYVPFVDRPDGRWRYHVPEELQGGRLREQYIRVLDDAFATYARWIEPMQAHFRGRHERGSGDTESVYRAAIRAKALDTLRGLLPAATRSNVGIFGTAQSYELLLLRMRAHPLAEARHLADLMLAELRKVIPAFLSRVDQEARGELWSTYIAETKAATDQLAGRLLEGIAVRNPVPEVSLTSYDPEGETKVVAAALYSSSDLPDDELLTVARSMPASERAAVLRTYRGDRKNRRHKPGRAFECTSYRFDILTDYGAFRDLQRHRLLTLNWQTLSTCHGYATPDAIEEAGAADDWKRVMSSTAELHDALVSDQLTTIAPYSVPMAYRVRFFMEVNAREAMHIIELRTTPQGHPAYRRVCQSMHRLIAEKAGHQGIADAMSFVDHSEVALERLEAERRTEQKRSKGTT